MQAQTIENSIEELQAKRERAKITRRELARKLAVSPSKIQRIEEQEQAMPTGFAEQYLEALQTIARERAVAVGAMPAEEMTAQ